MLGLEIIFTFVLLVFILFVGVCCCLCIHLPLCPLFCVGLGLGTAAARSARSLSRDDEESGGSLSAAPAIAARSVDGYLIVAPHEIREYDINNHNGDLSQNTLYNSMNPSGEVSDIVVEAYLMPPLHDVPVTQLDVTNRDDDSPENETPCKIIGFGDYGMFRDLLFAVLFLFNTLYVTSVAFTAISKQSERDEFSDYATSINNSNDSGMNKKSSENVNQDIGIRTAAAMVLGLSFFAIIITSSVFMSLIMSYSEQIISASIKMSIAIFSFLGFLGLFSGAVILPLFSFLISYMIFSWLRNAADRIAFASTVLKISVMAIREHVWGLFATAAFILVLQILWIFIWSISMMDIHNRIVQHNNGLYNNGLNKNESPASLQLDDTALQSSANENFPPVYLLMIFQLFWGIEVCKNVLGSTVSGTLACWWFTPQRVNSVGGAFFRSLTTSFGCVCLGSLFVSIVQTLRWLLSLVRGRVSTRERNGNSQLFVACAMCAIDVLLTTLESILQYFNKYAFTYVAAYGTNFVTSGLRVTKLFKKRGWDALINDNLIRNVLNLLVFAVSVTTGIFATIMALSWEHHLVIAGVQNPAVVLFFAGLVIGLAVSVLLSDVFDTAVACVFVFFAEDPHALRLNHPDIYEELLLSWLEMHPTSLIHITGESSNNDLGYDSLTDVTNSINQTM